jgi:hypothetical protein
MFNNTNEDLLQRYHYLEIDNVCPYEMSSYDKYSYSCNLYCMVTLTARRYETESFSAPSINV